MTGRPSYSRSVSAPYRLLPATVATLQTNDGRLENEQLLSQLGRTNFASSSQKRCGVAQICLGIVSLAVGGAAWGYQDGVFTFMFSLGLIAGVFLIIAGSVAIDSGRTEKYATIVACLVMSVFSAFFVFLFLVVSCATIWIDFSPVFDILEADGPIGVIDVIGTVVSLAGLSAAVTQVVISSRTVCKCCVRTELVFLTEDFGTNTFIATQELPPSLNYSINRDYGSRGPSSII